MVNYYDNYANNIKSFTNDCDDNDDYMSVELIFSCKIFQTPTQLYFQNGRVAKIRQWRCLT